MRLPPRARMTLGGFGMILLFGLLGLAWWWWHHRAGYRPAVRFRRVRTALVAMGLVIIAVGAIWRLTVAIQSVPGCTPPGGASPRSDPIGASLLAQQAATWPETGIGLLYSRAADARVCLSRSSDYYVAVHANNPTGAKAMTVGDIVLSPGFNMSRQE